MHQQIPTRWIAVLFLLAATVTWNACSKDYSFEKNNSSVINDLLPGDDSTNNDDDDSTGNGPVNGDTTDNGGNDDTTTLSDVDFMKHATYINRAQVTNGKLAIERGSTAAVRDFGQALQTRFGAAQGDMDALAVTMSVTIPGQTDATHQTATNTFLDMEGRTFDIGFIDYQMLELQRAIDLYLDEINKGTDQRVKEYAKKYLPYLQGFLQTASTIRQSL